MFQLDKINIDMKKYYIYALLAMSALACRQSPNPSSQNNLAQIAETPIDAALDSGATDEFAAKAAIGNMMEIESSAHMIKLTENRDVQNLATIMVKDHTATQRELATIAKQQKIFVPQTLPPAQKQMLARIDSLKEDERNFYYTKLMVTEHEKAVALFDQASKQESNAELAKFATAKLPGLKHHLAEAKRVWDIMQKIKPDKGDQPLKISQSREGKP